MVVNTEPSDLDKPPGQDVQGKASEELNAIHGKRLFDGPVAVIFGNEGYFSISNVQDALVGDGYPVGVLPQVFYNMLSAYQGLPGKVRSVPPIWSDRLVEQA
jgi:surface antigen